MTVHIFLITDAWRPPTVRARRVAARQRDSAQLGTRAGVAQAPLRCAEQVRSTVMTGIGADSY